VLVLVTDAVAQGMDDGDGFRGAVGAGVDGFEPGFHERGDGGPGVHWGGIRAVGQIPVARGMPEGFKVGAG